MKKGLLELIGVILLVIGMSGMSGMAYASLPELIVLPAAPSAVEKTAADELSKHLRQITGRDFPIALETERPEGKSAFLVGATAASKNRFAEFPPDGIAIVSQGDDIILTGHPLRGTLYAVYTLLEKYCGVRWFASDATVIPHNPGLSLENLNEVYAPPLRIREIHFTDAYKLPFAARLKNNGHFVQAGEEYGGHEKILGFCHTFNQILPASKYFKDHHEWYSMQKGQRSASHRFQLCLTNQEMMAQFISNAMDWLAKNPDCRVISVSQNDGLGRCECPDCLKVEEEEGSPSGPVIRFVNAVASEIAKKYPDVLVDTLAYSYTRKAPAISRPADNVSIRYCDIEADFSQPIETGANNVPIAEDIGKWSGIAKNMLVWHYIGDFGNKLLPYPSWANYANDIRFYIKSHAIGMFLEGDTHTDVSDFSRMRAWVLAHLLWDPSLDTMKLIDEFLDGYYGAAGRPLRKYLDLMERSHAASGVPLSLNNITVSGWLTTRNMVEAWKLYEEALASVVEDAVLVERVKVARTSLDSAILLMRPYMIGTGEDKLFSDEQWREMANNLSEQFRKHFIPRAGLVIALWNYDDRYDNLLAEKDTVPQGCEGLPRSGYVDFQQNLFCVAGGKKGTLASIVDDAAASDGKALKVIKGGAWCPQQHIHIPVTPGEKWYFRVTARIENVPGDTVVMRAGTYNIHTEKEEVRDTVRADQIGDTEYRTVELGPIDAQSDLSFYVMPNNVSAEKPLYIDRITVIRK